MLSRERWHALEPDLAPSALPRLLTRTPSPEQAFWRTWLPRALWRGTDSAAVVLHVDPLVVGAYSPVFDTCALLRFPSWLAQTCELSFGSRLVAVLAYLPPVSPTDTDGDRPLAPDLHLGTLAEEPAQVPGAGLLPAGHANMLPIVADFVCEPNSLVLRQVRDTIGEAQWIRAERRGREELWLSRGLLRDGRPSRAATPAGVDPATYPVRDLLLRSFRLIGQI